MTRFFLVGLLLVASAFIAPGAQAQDGDPVEQCIAAMDAEPGCKEFGASLSQAFRACGKRSCKRTCRAVKRDCKSDCRDTRRSCRAFCNTLSGREKRACKRICSNTVEDCRSTCKSTKTVCANNCTSRDASACRKVADVLSDVGSKSMLCLSELLGERWKCDNIIFSEEDLGRMNTE